MSASSKRISVASGALVMALGAPVVALGALAVWLAWRSRAWPLVHDAPIMHYIAWRISEGAVPYRDLFDMNFPGVYAFHLALVRWLGTGDAAWRAVDLTVTAITAVAIGALAAPWGRTAALGGAFAFACYHLASGAWNAGQRDFLLCPFLLAGALAVARWAEGASARTLAAGGVALGAGLTIKPHATLFVLGLAIVVVLCGRYRRRATGAALVALALGTAVAPAAALAWMLTVGAFAAWREITFGYLVPLYSRVSRPADWLYFRWHPWIAIGCAVALNLAHVAWTRRLSARHGVILVGIAYGLVHFVGQRKGWEYHLYPLAAFAAVLLLADLRAVAIARLRWLAGAMVASVVALVWLLGIKGAEASDSGWIAFKVRRVDAMVAELARRTRSGDRVQMLDTTEGGMHALLRLRIRQPTRFVYDFHFFHHVETPTIQRLRAELVRELADRPPRLIVVWEGGWPAGGYDRLDGFPALKAWLETTYVLATTGDGYRIYAKRHDS